MTEREVSPTDDIKLRQRQAGKPDTSVWVQANAGSGKTHVLTERVLRLLLSGAAPENLLCLTYTKAAAAEMRRRVADRLGQWAVMDDDALVAALIALEEQRPDAAKLSRARTLFGHALETPGGLKINTIHAFCESVLQRFPLEAGVPFGFSVIEEGEQAELIRAARDAVLAEGVEARGPVPTAVGTLFGALSDHQIEEAIASALGRGSDLAAVLADRQHAKTNLKTLLNLGSETITALELRLSGETLLSAESIRAIVNLLNGDPSKSSRFVDVLARVNPDHIDAPALVAALLTQKNEMRKTYLPKKERTENPDLADLCEREAARLIDIQAAITKRRLFDRSEALVDVLGAVVDRYQARKRAAAMLDFDDLIDRMRALLTRSSSRDWVRYKLDAAITHILVDESQDTNPEQWLLIKALVEEFFSGEGVARAPRTLFVVGDRKQSIYSFQGARPEMFTQLDREFGQRALQANHAFERVSLRASFRSLENILTAVDKVCAAPEIAAALLSDEDGNAHESARTDKGGMVVLWPPVQQADMDLPDGRWPLDSDAVEVRNAARQLAERITDNIQNWIETKRPLQQRGRAVTEDDVLILVQSRGALFQEIIRALKRSGLKSPGADKLPVSTHIAVRDLLALADVLLNPADDLGLAAVLRSPLFDLSEVELFNLAQPRAKGQQLWTVLGSSTDKNAAAAYQRLFKWRSRLDFERPYDFFAQVLYAEGGLRRFHGRLGEEVDDVLAEFLDLALSHERASGPGLQNFLAAMRKSDISIKRELTELGGGVRVMTVHGAKGLEAPIVILADAATGPNKQKMGKPVYVIPESPGPILVHASSGRDHSAETTVFRDADIANQAAEYWRKLYVGMTRAEDELYVTGVLTKSGKLDGTWYEVIDAALTSEAAPIEIAGAEIKGQVFPSHLPAPKPIVSSAATPLTRTIYQAGPPPKSQAAPIIQPSRAHIKSELFDSAAESLANADDARREGIAIHALLQHLSTVAPDMRDRVARGALEVLLPTAPDRHEALATRTMRIITDPKNAALFGANSRAEVPFIADLSINGKPARIVGRVDRLIVSDNQVLAVDFKSDANPPTAPEQIAPAYLTQLGLYQVVGKKLFPQHTIGAAIFWTTTETMMHLPDETLNRAMAAFTFTQPDLN